MMQACFPVARVCRPSARCEIEANRRFATPKRSVDGRDARATGKAIAVAFILLIAVVGSRPALGQATVVREVVQEATEQLFKQTGRQGLEELTQMGGKAAVREILEQSSREGGEQLVRKVTQYGIEDGPVALRAISRSPARMVEALDGISPELRVAGLRAVEREPQLMTQLVNKYGSGAMEVAAKHPGVGEKLAQSLGEDGINLGRKLTTDQSIVAARYAGDIANLPPAERSGVLSAIARSPAKALDYLETHPRTLRTAAGVAVVIAIKDDILGDKGSSVVRPDGTVVSTAARPGLIERMFPSASKAASTPIALIAGAVALGILGWFSIHLWGKWRRTAG
jgi:hypothetical protein